MEHVTMEVKEASAFAKDYSHGAQSRYLDDEKDEEIEDMETTANV